MHPVVQLVAKSAVGGFVGGIVSLAMLELVEHIKAKKQAKQPAVVVPPVRKPSRARAR